LHAMQCFIVLDDVICSKKRPGWDVALLYAMQCFIVLDNVIIRKKRSG